MKLIKTTLQHTNLLGKFLLTLALVVFGGGNFVWADEMVVSFQNSSIPSGWTNGTYNNVTLDPFTTTTEGINAGYKTSGYFVTSDNTIRVNTGEKIRIYARWTQSVATAAVKLYATTDKNNFGDPVATFTRGSNGTSYYYQLVKDNLDAGDYYLRLQGTYVMIEAFDICASDAPDLILNESTSSYISHGTKSKLKVQFTPKNGWNTICMPFQLKSYSTNYLNDIFGTDYSAYTLSGYNTDTKTLSFSTASNIISANTPLLVNAPNATNNLKTLDLENISVTYSASPSSTAYNGVKFQGTYTPTEASYLKSIGAWGITSDGSKLRKAGSNTTIKGYRAYFTGLPYNIEEARVITIDENGETTDLGFVKLVDPEAKEIYNLQGQRVEKGRKGIYIVNGKKVVIK